MHTIILSESTFQYQDKQTCLVKHPSFYIYNVNELLPTCSCPYKRNR